MKPKSKQNLSNALRWIVLLPAICLVWWTVSFICITIERWFPARLLLGHHFWLGMITYFIILPAVAMFFTAKYIAPKHKILMGCIAVCLCILWGLFLWYGLSHMAY